MAQVDRLLAAIKFASQKHAQQKRKDAAGTPYINHPIEVAELLSRVAEVSDIEILSAAILHDTVEDTNTTKEEIAQLFGARVAAYVMECTDDKTLPKQERKRLQIESAPYKSAQAKLIKIADKIINVKDLGESPPKDWGIERQREYLDWTERVVHGLRGISQALDELYDSTLSTARSKIERNSEASR